MPNNLPNRKKLRYENFDYSENGYYFVTILTKNRENFFGKIKNGEVVLSEIGKMAHTFFQEIPLHFPDCQVDEFIIMPNHIHGIIIIDNGEVFVRNADLRSLPTDKTKMLLSKVVH